MIEAHGRARAEFKGPKWKGRNTNTRVEVKSESDVKGSGRRTHGGEQAE